ncbi:MAG: serine/threonine-protein kinase [bacterium]
MSKYSSYILYLLIAVLVVVLYINDFSPMSGLQQTIHDWLTRVTTSTNEGPNVCLVMIDEQARKEYGAWPWDRDLVADLLAASAAGEPRAIALDMDLSEDAFQDSAGHNAVLAGQLGWIKNVVLPYDIALSTYRTSQTKTAQYLFDHSLSVDNPLGVMDERSSLLVRKVFLPAGKILSAKPLLGFDYTMPDDDRVLRRQAMVMTYEGYNYPSLALAAAAAYFRIPTEQVTVVEDDKILVGVQRSIPIGKGSEYYIRHLPADAFTTYSAAELLSDGFDRSLLKGRMVLIGAAQPDDLVMFDIPGGKQVSKLQVTASVLDNIISDDMLTVRTDRAAVDMIIMFAIGALGAFFLPQLRLARRLLSLLAMTVVLVGVTYYFAAFNNTLIQPVFFALELLLFMAASLFLDSILLAAKGAREEAMAAVTVAAKQGDKDKSKSVPVRKIPASVSDPENVPTRHIDSRPLAAEDTVAVTDGSTQMQDYQAITLDDSSEVETPLATAPEAAAPDDSGNLNIIGNDQELGRSAEAAIVTPSRETTDAPRDKTSNQPRPAASQSGGTQLKSLGRYQVTGVLGKGAMGKVYRGLDPAINRPVALKTIRLDFVNDPEEEAELKERLHREAQAAGKLSHTNIVTIYDVGSEGQLQYIAMEYLEGETLEDMIKRKVQFNYRILAQIIMQICSALQYAHDRQIVHRDIKPANIMILKDYQTKVMDFGIARVESHSMTKTGIAMGTPNYISPEQLRGQTIDNRADIFSLGVVIYELLLGKRPFRGENITSLIYSVLNHQPDKPSNVNPQVPLLFDHIVEKALQKEPKNRYQKASELMVDLASFVEAFAN